MYVKQKIYAHELYGILSEDGQNNYEDLEEMGVTEEQLYRLTVELLADGDENKAIDLDKLIDLFANHKGTLVAELMIRM